MLIFVVLLFLYVGKSQQTFTLFSFSSKVNLNNWCTSSFNAMKFVNTNNGIEVTYHTQVYCGGSFIDRSTPEFITTLKNVTCNSAEPNAVGTYYDFYGDIHCLFEPPTPNNPSNFVQPNQCIFGSQCFKQSQPNNWIMNTCILYPKTGGILL